MVNIARWSGVMPLKVLGYVRQSLARDGESEETSLSLDGQESAIRARAETEGWTVVEVLRDHDLSGADPNRPGMIRLKDHAFAGGIDAVVVFDLKRFARDNLYQETTYRELKAHGVKLISLADPHVDHTMMRQIQGAINEYQREELARYIRMAYAERAKRGLHAGPVPFGYTKIDGLLSPCPDHAERYRWIVDRFLAGVTYQQIAAELNASGIPPNRAAYWMGDTVRYMLRNSVYAGDVSYHGEIVARDGHPALIDRATWSRIQDEIARRSVVKKKNSAASWCEGLVRHVCGHRMYLQVNRRGHRYFGCRGAYLRFALCREERRFLMVAKVERASRLCLANDLRALLSLDQAIERAKHIVGGDRVQRERNRLSRLRGETRDRRDRAEHLYTTGRRCLSWLDGEDVEIQAALAQIDQALVALPEWPERDRFAQVHDQLTSFAAVVLNAPDDAVRAFLHEVGEIEVSADGVRINYYPPWRNFMPVGNTVSIKPRTRGIHVGRD